MRFIWTEHEGIDFEVVLDFCRDEVVSLKLGIYLPEAAR